MENNNTIELNVVRLGGKSNGRVPTKLSEMENDCNFIERNAFMQGQQQKQIGCYIECGVEYKVLTKTKGQTISIRFATDPNWGSMSSLYKLQLIIKDMNGNDVVRFPSGDALNNKLATPSYCMLSTNAYLQYEPDDGGSSIVFNEPIPEECELYLFRTDNTECYVVANATIDGYMSVEQTMDKFNQSLTSKVDSSALGSAAYKNVEDLQGGGGKWNLLQTISLSGSAQSFPIISNMGEGLYTDGLLVVVNSSQDLTFNFGYGADQIKGKVIEIERLGVYPESGSPASMQASFLIKGDNSAVIDVVHPGFGETTIDVSNYNGDELSGMIRLFYKKISNLKS